MASWGEVFSAVKSAPSPLDEVRASAIGKLAEYRGRNVICYYSGWLQVPNSYASSINDDDMNGLMNAVYGLDKSKGLDLVLHTPGGDLAATEAIVNYLRDCFGNDICAIVPQMAMSAGTMIACSCREVIMGKQSSLGPTDPQLGGVAAGGVVEEFEEAVKQIGERPESAALWGQIIGKYHPTFIGDCQKAITMSHDIVRKWLTGNMLAGDPDRDERADKIVGLLGHHEASAMHNRHFSHNELDEIGVHVKMMEDDDELQDRILTVHHAFMVTFQKAQLAKIIESSNGQRWLISDNAPR